MTTDTGRLLDNTIGATPEERELIEAGKKLASAHRVHVPGKEGMYTELAPVLAFHEATTNLLESLISDRAKLREALEPFARAAEAVEINDPSFPDDGAALRASFDFWTRTLGRDNDELVTRDSVRLSDLRRAALVLKGNSNGE